MKIVIEYLLDENEETGALREGVRVSFNKKVVIDEWEGKNLDNDVLFEQMMTLLGHEVEIKHDEGYDYCVDDCETNFSQFDGDDIIGHRG
jgi:hypothetical protein